MKLTAPASRFATLEYPGDGTEDILVIDLLAASVGGWNSKFR
jgi:hypothetical protein